MIAMSDEQRMIIDTLIRLLNAFEDANEQDIETKNGTEKGKVVLVSMTTEKVMRLRKAVNKMKRG